MHAQRAAIEGDAPVSVNVNPGINVQTVKANTSDVLIVGGGHNGLVAACHLARAGFSVTVLEKYKDVGGAAYSEEIEGAPGHIASTGSDVLSLAPQKVLRDLDLGKYGLEMLKRDPRSFGIAFNSNEMYVSCSDGKVRRFTIATSGAVPTATKGCVYNVTGSLSQPAFSAWDSETAKLWTNSFGGATGNRAAAGEYTALT